MNTATAISNSFIARNNCAASGNSEWLVRWTEEIDNLVSILPSGGGFDDGTEIIDADDKKISFKTAFHHMDEHGYDGWTMHTITVWPTFGGMDIRVSGVNKNDIKEYIVDVFSGILASEYSWTFKAVR